MRRKLPRLMLLPATLLVFCRLFLTDPGLAAGAVVFTPRIDLQPTIGPCPRIHVRLDAPPAAEHPAGMPEAERLRREVRLWLMGLQAGADALARYPAVIRYFMSAESRLPLAAMLYGAEGAEETSDGCMELLLEPRPLTSALEAALRPGPLYGAWKTLLGELEQTLALTPSGGPEDEEQVVRLRALFGSARTALAGADESWLASADLALELEHAAVAVKDSPLLWLLLAEAALQRDQPQRSVGACGRALALRPGLARARYIRALGYWRLHQLALAENDLSIILHGTPQPHMAPWLRARGAIRMLRGNTDGMCEDFRAACLEGDCDGLEMARQRDLCREPGLSARAEETAETGPAAGALPPEARQRADYLGSLVLAFLGAPEAPPVWDAETATLLGFLAADSSQRPSCPRRPLRAMRLRLTPLPPEGSEADGHDLPLVDEDFSRHDARRRGSEWAENLLLLLGVDVRLSGLSAGELRDLAEGRTLAELGLSPPEDVPTPHCPRRLWAAPAQWDVDVPLTAAAREAFWRAIDTAVSRSRQETRATPPRRAGWRPSEGTEQPDVAAQWRGTTRRVPFCPLPRFGEDRAAVWERVWEDAWFVRIKSLAYALRDEDYERPPRRADVPPGKEAVGPPEPPSLKGGRWGYPAHWNWIRWPGQTVPGR